MRPLSPEQQHYLDRRLNAIRWWNRLGWLILVAVAGFYGWLWSIHPLFVDPMLLLEKLRVGGVADIEVARLAALGNLAFIGCGLLLAGMVFLTYAAMWTEKTTIRQLTAGGEPPAPEMKPVLKTDGDADDQPQA